MHCAAPTCLAASANETQSPGEEVLRAAHTRLREKMVATKNANGRIRGEALRRFAFWFQCRRGREVLRQAKRQILRKAFPKREPKCGEVWHKTMFDVKRRCAGAGPRPAIDLQSVQSVADERRCVCCLVNDFTATASSSFTSKTV